MKVFLLLLCSVFVIRDGTTQLPPERFRVIKEWKYINFTWPDFNSLRSAIAKEEYIPRNTLISGINYYQDYYYLALPRMKSGIPITLGRIPINSTTRPLIEPFPSWEMNKLDDCNAMQNVQNVAIDSKSIMWIIDSGKTNTLSQNANIKCDPKLILYNLEKKSIEEIHIFPAEVADKKISFLYDLVVDDDFAYITDNSRFDPGLIVFSRIEKKSWKIKHDSMKADPEGGNFTVDDVRISSPINIAGIALSPKIHQNDGSTERVLFYSAMSNENLYSVKTHYLKDEGYNPNGVFHGHIVNVGLKGGQTDGMKMDNKGVLYFGLLPSSAVVKWDSSTPFSTGQKVIARDPNFIQWTNSFAFDDSGSILVLTNSLQKYIQGIMDVQEPNFRILKAYVNSKSYVYEDNSSAYMVYEEHPQNKTETASSTEKLSSSTTTENPTTRNAAGEDVTITRMMSSAGTLRAFIFCVLLGLTLNLLR